MEKQLLLIRHSYAQLPGQVKDIERPLTMEGHTTARALGRYMEKEGLVVDRIVCSKAVRTSETAIHLVEEMHLNEQLIYFDDLIYNASVRELLNVINSLPDELNNVVLLGHNPSISYISEYITGASFGGFQPAGLASISFKVNSWQFVSQGNGDFKGYYHPKVSN